MPDASGRLRLSAKGKYRYGQFDNDVKKIMMELTKWRKFDKLIHKKFKENFHLGETQVNIAEYMETQLQLSLIGAKATKDKS